MCVGVCYSDCSHRCGTLYVLGLCPTVAHITLFASLVHSPAGYATPKASWIPNRERERLIPRPPPGSPCSAPHLSLHPSPAYSPNLTLPPLSSFTSRTVRPVTSFPPQQLGTQPVCSVRFKPSFLQALVLVVELFFTHWLHVRPHGYRRSCPRDRCVDQPTAGKNNIQEFLKSNRAS